MFLLDIRMVSIVGHKNGIEIAEVPGIELTEVDSDKLQKVTESFQIGGRYGK